MTDRKIKLEAMLLHLLHSKSPDGKLWKAITIPGVARFTREDVEREIAATHEDTIRWWQFWK